MAQTAKRVKVNRQAPSQPSGPTPEEIAELLKAHGLKRGDSVRFRRRAGGTWTPATVDGVNKDGSLSLFAGGKFRAIFADLCEVRALGPKGGVIWEPLKGKK